MKVRFAPTVFSLAFCCVYMIGFAGNVPLFLYYPLHGDFSWGPHALTGIGPAMAWYGLMADAGIVAALLAIGLPEKRVSRVFAGYLWVVPGIAMLLCVCLLRKFFA